MTLEEAREMIGHGVVYDPKHGPVEDGVIVGVSPSYVFVRYRGDETAKATRPEDLTPPTPPQASGMTQIVGARHEEDLPSLRAHCEEVHHSETATGAGLGWLRTFHYAEHHGPTALAFHDHAEPPELHAWGPDDD